MSNLNIDDSADKLKLIDAFKKATEESFKDGYKEGAKIQKAKIEIEKSKQSLSELRQMGKKLDKLINTINKKENK